MSARRVAPSSRRNAGPGTRAHVGAHVVIIPPRERATREWHWLSALDDAPVALLVLSPLVDPAGAVIDLRIEYANRAWQNLLGEGREQPAGRRLYETFPPTFEQRRILDRVLETGETATELIELPGAIWVEYRVARSDRSLVVSAREVTERVQAGHALRESEERYRSLVEGLDAIVSVRDMEAGTTWVSAQAEGILGYSPVQLAEPGFWRRLVVSEDSDRAAAVWDHDDDLNEYHLEYRVRRADGQTIWLHERMTCVRDGEGHPLRWYGLTFDITEARQLRQRRIRTERLEAVGQFASGVAHDFNEILLAISLFAGFVRDSLAEDDPRAADLEQVTTTAERGRALVSQLVAFARGQDSAMTPIDPAAIAREFAPILQRLVGRAVEVRVTEKADAGRVLGDRTQFEQVLLNLATNAAHAMPGGGRLDIDIASVPARRQCCEAAGCVRVFVRDTGVGMTAATAARAFEPFFTTRRRGYGAGLGLATAHTIVDAFGGTIDLSSARGSGTSFEILLPRLPTENEPEPVGAGQRTRATGRRARTP